ATACSTALVSTKTTFPRPGPTRRSRNRIKGCAGIARRLRGDRTAASSNPTAEPVADPVTVHATHAAAMLFRRPELEGIAAGTITLAFRRWDRPRVRPGGKQRTAVGMIAFGGVRLVRTISDEDARRAGQQSAAELLEGLRTRPGDIYRIEVCL